MNKELGADFKIDDFDFYCHYNPLTGDVKSYIISLRKQIVNIEALKIKVDFEYNELIWTELSRKFAIKDINDMAIQSNFKLNHNFLDCKHYFTDSL